MEIKVRFWDVRHQEMVYPPFFTSRDLVEDREWIPMLWTGMKDKNGLDIYAGDIVTIVESPLWYLKEAKAVVVYKEGAFEFDRTMYGAELRPTTLAGRIEVSGDIYRNADLLTQEGK